MIRVHGQQISIVAIVRIHEKDMAQFQISTGSFGFCYCSSLHVPQGEDN